MALVKIKLGIREQEGSWFSFSQKRRTQINVFYYHQGGCCLWLIRLAKGTFARADDEGSKRALK
ncbi:IS66 family insertion sequence element accessory protein TnpB [Paraglaciecola sp. MB-3u-78]|uniref:IS66 family insertion sequence element accessory protein TnpB n=1 Tax=Paraglaciecola sp. MB-3u-78 TaxID=2058332 RepID=UPI000C323A53|nr:hypothetical protein CXF95_29090 [Paraglaciecola sp. MB-3u-78]